MKKIIHRLIRNSRTMSQNGIAKGVVLEWWNYETNIGDTLSPVIVNWVLNQKNIEQNSENKRIIHLLALGSIIGLLDYDALIWGSGIHKFSSIVDIARRANYVKYDIRAVRGPLTRQALMACGYDCPEIYGDPAILMPLIYNKNTVKKYRFTLIPHMHMFDEQNKKYDKIMRVLDVRTTDYKTFIDGITESECIISASLHGIILAESYGVPAVLLMNGMESEILKYYDWYWATGRRDVRVATSVEDAMKMHPMELPDLSQMRDSIIAAFPIDAWQR